MLGASGFCCLVIVASNALAIDVTPSASGGPSAQTLASNIANDTQATSGILIIGTATTNVNNSAFGNPTSDPRAMGSFTNGMTAPGTLLPAANQNQAGNAQYAGGIGISSGVCLCTGFVSDSINQATQSGLGFEVEGPNNGDGEGIIGTPSQNHSGEISRVLFFGEFDGAAIVDQDFEDIVFPDTNPGGGDATVLQFPVTITKPSFLSLSFVFGSDEHPFYDDNSLFPFNDSIAIIVDGENIATINEGGALKPFSLFEFKNCAQLFVENNTAPSPSVLTPQYTPPNLHAIPSADRYDIEFGGFTKPLTRETTKILAPGTYTVKIVVQDVSDRRVDAAVFLAENSLTLFPFLVADFDLDGDIDGSDFLIWQRNYLAINATFQQGDANGDGTVNTQDLVIWGNNYGQSGGNKNYCSDFDRDGDADGQDFLIWQRNFGMEHCASRFEGDASGDGAVDACDLSIWQAEYNSGPMAVCACDGGEMAMIAGGGEQSLADASGEYDPADANQDGQVDATDVALWLDFYRELGK